MKQRRFCLSLGILTLLSLFGSGYGQGFLDIFDETQNNYFYRRFLRCPDGWNQRCDRCFLVQRGPLTWIDAVQFCRRNGGDLVSIRNRITNRYIGRLLRASGVPGSTAWIGGNDRDFEGRFKWSDGSLALLYDFIWLPFARSRRFFGEDCVEMHFRSRGNRWREARCSKRQPFVCAARACYFGQFRCTNGRCVGKDSMCDGVDDCGDRSDERNCGAKCGGVFKGPSGTIRSPDFPGQYPSNADCLYEIEVSANMRIELTFTTFIVERSYDFVYVYDGSSVTDPLLARLTGNRALVVVRSSSNTMLVNFRSDDTVEDDGFVATYKEVKEDCGGDITVNNGKPVEITSPNFPSEYASKLDCTWTITTSNPRETITLEIIDFDTEAVNDEVKIVDGTNPDENVLGELSGNLLNCTHQHEDVNVIIPRLYHSSGSSMLVVFQTNDRTNRKGFRFRVTRGCDGSLAVQFNSIVSPGFPNRNYPRFLNCKWSLKEPMLRNYTMVCHFFDTEKNYDIVTVEDGRNGGQIRLLDGTRSKMNQVPFSVITYTYDLEVKFKSDRIYEERGFNCTYSVDCPMLSAPQNGSVSPSTSHYGTEATYSCARGYKLENGKNRYCSFGGRWIGTVPTCEEIFCGAPERIDNGMVTVTGLTFDHTATYKCLGGYRLDGDMIRTCQENDRWSGSPPKCINVGCGDPGVPNNGNRTGDDFKVGSVVSFSCNEGFFVDGVSRIVCKRDGNWSHTIPTCQRITCQVPTAPTNGKITFGGNGPLVFGANISFACNSGYALNGSASLLCLATGRLSDQVPTCQDEDECLRSPCIGQGAVCTNVIGSFRCTCLPGWKLQPDGLNCDDVNECAQGNGGCNRNCTNLPGSYICTCPRGETLCNRTVDTDLVSCVEGRTCVGVRCPQPPTTDGGRYFGSSIRYPNSIVYMCPDQTVAVLRCLETGKWDRAFPDCSVHNCTEPEVGPTASVSYNGLSVDSEATYTCKSRGYVRQSGDSLRYCRRNGTMPYWSGSPLVCEKRDCGYPGTLQNGSVMVNGTLFEDKAHFSCDSGFVLLGEAWIKCLEDGQWSASVPKCVVADCPDPGIIANGERTGNLRVGETVTYRCTRDGYSLVGSANRTCIHENGNGSKWTGSLPQCVDMQSPVFVGCRSYTVVLPKFENRVFYNWTEPTVTDNSGLPVAVQRSPDISSPNFLAHGKTNITYTAADQAGNRANCVLEFTVLDQEPPRVSCPNNIEILSNLPVKVIWEGGKAEDNVGVKSITFTPTNGTELESDTHNDITMTAMDLDGNEASCHFEVYVKGCGCTNRGCGYMPRNGLSACTVNVNFPTPLISCNLACPNDRAFSVLGYDGNNVHCRPEGVWTKQNIPGCAKKERVIACYTATLSVTYSGNVSTVVRPLATNFTSSVDRVVDALRTAPACGTTTLSRNSEVTLSVTDQGLVANVSLKLDLKGFNAVDNQLKDKLLLCLEGLEQSLVNKTAELNAAAGSVMVEGRNRSAQSVSISRSGFCCKNGLPCCRDGTLYQKGDTIELSYCVPCAEGMFYNSTSSKCDLCPIDTFQNSEGQMSCSRCPANTGTMALGSVKCSELCKPGTFSITGYSPVCVSCQVGYYQSSYGAKDCLKCPNGTTTVGMASVKSDDCLAPCKPGHVSSTGLIPCKPCELGTYQPLTGKAVCKPCNASARFGGKAGATNENECPNTDPCTEKPCQNGGVCEASGFTYVCKCLPGWVGKNCETDFDDCKSRPCLNGGSCLDRVNGYNCTCSAGFTGLNCETNIDDCQPSPCKNGSHCEDLVSDYRCLCAPGFTGKNCDTDIDECATVPCVNGTCVNGRASYTCNCVPGFEGKNCDREIDECRSLPCQNGANCTDLLSDYRCGCPAGFTGKNCETNIDECAGMPCKNNGTCVDQVNGYQCVCLNGFTGPDCGVDINECVGVTCFNNGSCLDLIGKFECSCRTGFTGALCETNIDDCKGVNCTNGVCQDKINDYICICKTGFEGRHCEINTNDCATSPCVNGTCVDLIGRFRCDCIRGFDGDRCENNINDCTAGICKNGGICQDLVDDYRCNCQVGFTGRHCEVNIDDCVHCSNHTENCTDLVNDYSCHCETGYTGKDCSSVIDYCDPNPCRHNSTCENRPTMGTYFCNCVLGYEGKNCENEIKECLSNPCMNGGTCIDLIGLFRCDCPTGFTGIRCETNIDDCAVDTPCNNAGTCIDLVNDYMCKCRFTHTGERCDKVRSPMFDLRLTGNDNSYVAYPNITTTQQLSISVWIRFGDKDGQGVAIVMHARSSNGSTTEYFRVDSQGLTLFNQFPVPIKNINSGLWNHLAFTLGSSFKVYFNRRKELEANFQTQAQGESWIITIGNHRGLTSSYQNFRGEISQFGIWDRVLSEDKIIAFSNGCSSNLTGSRIHWLQIADAASPNVVLVQPLTCGNNTCPPGFKGDFCEIEIDKIPPKVVFCPDDQIVVWNSSRLVDITWQAPSFTDENGIASVTKSHNPNQTFTYGDFVVTYIAADPAGNIATCIFRVLVMPFRCPIIPVPKNAAKVCSTWENGRFCRCECFKNFQFDKLQPPFYSCGKNGEWSHGPSTFPENPDNRVPDCSPTSSAISLGITSVQYQTTGCTEEFQKLALEAFKLAIQSANAVFPICGGTCDFSRVSVTCSTASRKRRATGDAQTATMTFSVSYSSENQTEINNIAESFQESIKTNAIDFNLKVNGTVLNATDGGVQSNVMLTCSPGSVLQEDVCVLCSSGNYYNSSTKTCEPCEIGFYQPREGNTSCIPCPAGTTTLGNEAKSLESCKVMCSPGYYFSAGSASCKPCAIGFYQEESGSASCEPCSIGKTTRQTGSNSSMQCTDACGLGQSLNNQDKCVPCERGTFKNMQNQTTCQPCEDGKTTYMEGATDEDLCKAACPAGKEVTTDGKGCIDCLNGYFRPGSDLPNCQQCQPNFFTRTLGSTRESQCISILDSARVEVSLRLTSETYKASLQSRFSSDYRSLAARVTSAISKIYESEGRFRTVEVIKFSSGSVIATAALLFNTSFTDPLMLLRQATERGTIGSIPTDTQYLVQGNCNGASCDANAFCKTSGNSATCSCVSTHYGDGVKCYEKCKDNYCSGNGKCIEKSDGRGCNCDSGYSGDRCENKTGPRIAVIVVVTLAVIVFIAVVSWLFLRKRQGSMDVKNAKLRNSSPTQDSFKTSRNTYDNPTYDSVTDSPALSERAGLKNTEKMQEVDTFDTSKV